MNYYKTKLKHIRLFEQNNIVSNLTRQIIKHDTNLLKLFFLNQIRAYKFLEYPRSVQYKVGCLIPN